MLAPELVYSSIAKRPECPERLLFVTLIATPLHDAQSRNPVHRHYARLFLQGDGVAIAADLAGIDRDLVDILRNWTTPAPAPKPTKPSKAHYIQVNGAPVRVVAVARQHGVKPGTVVARLARGWTPRQALELEPPPPRRHAMRRRIKADCASAGR